ncbi:DUF4185 domain-containing protein [Mycobacterium sp. IDR2000157661]|uniref:DUF4185 domain-containing protein n=1 Tax=Mycobacterium sp. IDR2000157661 TaxID=2867005 RepID=UPI001EE9DC96|nr:DUF4185 domain-containing protein [Mycobacterium sp. IDR2000157661]ULE31978.1 DUF4185 domain-containing protein [Mycobacterium sp. IDR2000157661]
MGAARYIGRVGGLAVALGVGTAIATGHGIASADSTESNTSNPPNTEQSSNGNTTDTVTATGTTTGTDTQSTLDEGDDEDADEDAADEGDEAADEGDDSSTTTTTVTGGVTVSAQTNTGSSSSEPTSGEQAEGAQPNEPAPTGTVEPGAAVTLDPGVTPDSSLEQKPAASTDSNGGSEVITAPASGSFEPQTSPAGQTQPTTATSARTVQSLSDPATTFQEAAQVAVFADARVLAGSATQTYAPMTASTAVPAPAAPRDVFTAVANVVSSALNWVLSPLAGNVPGGPAQPPLIWGLLAFARREFDRFFAALAGGSTASTSPTALTAPTSLTSPTAFSALTEPMARLAMAAPVIPTPAPPFPAQVSPSTKFVSWVTGPYVYPSQADATVQNPLLANTLSRYSVYGTDLGIMWDNGIPDNPLTKDINENQVLIAVGDTFAGPYMQGDWRSNTIFRSSDIDLANGMEIPDGQWYNGNMFGGAPLGPTQYRARQVIFPEGLPAGITLIPTAGVSIPTPGSRFGAIQYVSFMSVTQWGAPGSWTTNYSAIAYSDDNGETFKVAPQTVRYNQPWTGNQNFQQSAFVRPGDGYVYMYGTPNGRQGAAYVSRVPEKDILNLSQYEYYSKGTAGGWFGWGATPAGWHKNNPGAATSVFGVDQGACGVANPGNQVSEMSVQYNKSLNKYVVLYGDQFNNIVMRTSDTPQGTWSSAKVLMPQQAGGIYAPMMHPWSPSTLGSGNDLYWNLSHWGNYNVMLMRTDLSKV